MSGVSSRVSFMTSPSWMAGDSTKERPRFAATKSFAAKTPFSSRTALSTSMKCSWLSCVSQGAGSFCVCGSWCSAQARQASTLALSATCAEMPAKTSGIAFSTAARKDQPPSGIVSGSGFGTGLAATPPRSSRFHSTSVIWPASRMICTQSRKL